MVRLGTKAQAGNRISGRRVHLEGFVGVGVGRASAGGVKARHWGSEGAFGGRIWGRKEGREAGSGVLAYSGGFLVLRDGARVGSTPNPGHGRVELTPKLNQAVGCQGPFSGLSRAGYYQGLGPNSRPWT